MEWQNLGPTNLNRNIEKDLLHVRIKFLLLFFLFSGFFRWFGSLAFLWHTPINITIFDRKSLQHRVPGLQSRFVGQNSTQALTNCLVVADFCWTPQSMTRFCLSTGCVFYALKHTVDSFPWVLWVLAGGQMSCNLETVWKILWWMSFRLQNSPAGEVFPSGLNFGLLMLPVLFYMLDPKLVRAKLDMWYVFNHKIQAVDNFILKPLWVVSGFKLIQRLLDELGLVLPAGRPWLYKSDTNKGYINHVFNSVEE